VSTVGSNRGEREENVSEGEGEEGCEEAGFGEAARVENGPTISSGSLDRVESGINLPWANHVKEARETKRLGRRRKSSFV